MIGRGLALILIVVAVVAVGLAGIVLTLIVPILGLPLLAITGLAGTVAVAVWLGSSPRRTPLQSAPHTPGV